MEIFAFVVLAVVVAVIVGGVIYIAERRRRARWAAQARAREQAIMQARQQAMTQLAVMGQSPRRYGPTVTQPPRRRVATDDSRRPRASGETASFTVTASEWAIAAPSPSHHDAHASPHAAASSHHESYFDGGHSGGAGSDGSFDSSDSSSNGSDPTS